MALLADPRRERAAKYSLLRVLLQFFAHGYPAPSRVERIGQRGPLRASDDRLAFDNGRILGECCAIAPDTLSLWFGFAAIRDSSVTEMMQLSADGGHRARTWHWLRDGVLEKVTLVREQRVAERTLATG